MAQRFRVVATVTFKPLTLSGHARVFGPGRDLGLWSVAVCNSTGETLVLPRERIMQQAPSIHEDPNALAQDTLTRKANRSIWSVLRATGGEAVALSPAGLSAAGMVTGKASLGYIGIGTAVLTYIVSRAKLREPDPQPYFAQLLPEAGITLAPLGCGTWLVAAALQPNVATIGPDIIDMPVPAGVGK